MIAARAAIAHDWFQGMHGSERVVASMLSMFEPRPDVYTFHAARELLPEDLAAAIVRESRVARLPGLRQVGHSPGRWRALLPYMPRWWERLPLPGYDVVISSSHACAVAAHPSDGAPHLCYCYTPMRYLWLEETERDRVEGARRIALRALRGRLRAADLRAAQRPDRYVAPSTAVAERVARIYGREAEVVPPPVAVQDFRHDLPKDPQHFLWVHRFVAYKRPLEVAAAFAQLPDLRLTMVGVGPLAEEVRRSAPPNVEVLGWTSREQLAGLYAAAAGFVHVGEEDFGITMVEALASGTPVLALAAGGALDIVRPGRDGELIAHAGEIGAGVEALARGTWDRGALRARAEEFSEPAFHRRLGQVLRSLGVG